MSGKQKFGAGIWHFATYVDRYATDGYGPPKGLIEMIDLAGQVDDLSVVDINYPFADRSVSLDDVEVALKRNKLSVIGITPEIYTRQFAKGAFTNPDPGVRRLANEMINDAANVVRRFGASYVKLWPGQDGWDYPFQVDHQELWKASMDGVGQLASENPDLKFVIEYKPREPRVHMSYDSVARTLLGIEKIGLPNVGILLDFGHSLYGGESPADAAQLAIDYGRLFGMDVNDNFRSLGRRPDGGFGAPDRTFRVLLHAEKEQLGRRVAAGPVPVPRGLCRGCEHRYRLSEAGRSRAGQTRL